MPRRVDREERRQRIAGALLRVVARDGLAAVSLRHVAGEAGVTTGMVQHYFPSKDSMMEFAMRTASASYENRIREGLAELGENPTPREIIGILLGALLPADEAGEGDARVALAFQAYAVTHADAAAYLEEGNVLLRTHLAGLIRANSSHPDPAVAATGLLGTAEGLAIHMLTGTLSAADARGALANLIDAVLDAT